MNLLVTIEGGGPADLLARRLVQDLNDVSGIGSAGLSMRAGEPGDRGLIEDVGGVVITLLNAGGADALIQLLRGIFPHQQPKPVSQDRVIVIERRDSDGVIEKAELRGSMSDDEFLAATNRVLGMLDRGQKGATP